MCVKHLLTLPTSVCTCLRQCRAFQRAPIGTCKDFFSFPYSEIEREREKKGGGEWNLNSEMLLTFSLFFFLQTFCASCVAWVSGHPKRLSGWYAIMNGWPNLIGPLSLISNSPSFLFFFFIAFEHLQKPNLLEMCRWREPCVWFHKLKRKKKKKCSYDRWLMAREVRASVPTITACHPEKTAVSGSGFFFSLIFFFVCALIIMRRLYGTSSAIYLDNVYVFFFFNCT